VREGADIVPRSGERGSGTAGARRLCMSNGYQLSPCPACGADESECVANAEQMRAEMEALWAFHLRRLHTGTPPERLADRTFFSQDPPLRLARCAGCGLVFRNPRETERTLREAYSDDAVDTATLEALFHTQRAAYRTQARRLTTLLGRTGSGLEVGSYVGAFLAAAAEGGWHFRGVDVNPAAAAFARAQGFAVQQGTLEHVDPEPRFDAIAIWNTFEQLPEPRTAAVAALRLLRPGGLLALRVPNGDFYRLLRRRAAGRGGAIARALLAHNNLLGFPYRHGFTPASLRGLLERSGFREVKVVGDVLVPIADRNTRRWAAAEERLVKTVLKGMSPAITPPWFEIYATPK
jgi:SAM-dependent methyltransferase